MVILYKLRRPQAIRCIWLLLLAAINLSSSMAFQLMMPTTILSNNRQKLNHRHCLVCLQSTAVPTPLSDLELGLLTDSDIERELLIGKPFQLEEFEDNANCITEIVLQGDHTLHVGQSDGPLFQHAEGSWSFDSSYNGHDLAFAMKLHRTYKAGYKGSDMGEFSFVVSRTFVGSLANVGESLAVEGSIFDDAVEGGRDVMQVGFFSMIDTTPLEEDEEDGDDDDNQQPNFMRMRTSSSF